jgi:hypothetical protein
MSETNLQNPRSGRRQYLITYSQADINKFPTRESFGKMLENEFNAGTSQVKVSVCHIGPAVRSHMKKMAFIIIAV